MSPYLIALDIDGTILATGQDRISTRVVNSIRSASKFHKVIFASGRSYSELKGLIDQIDFKPEFHILGGGSFIWDGDGTEVASYILTPKDVSDIQNAIGNAQPLCSWGLIDSEWQALPNNLRDKRIFAMSFQGRDASHAAQMEASLASLSERFCVASVSHSLMPTNVNLILTHRKANKGMALQEVASRLTIPRERIIAIGDMPIDIPMFEVAGHAVAMGQAPDLVKLRATLIAPSVDEDGVTWALEQLLDCRGQ